MLPQKGILGQLSKNNGTSIGWGGDRHADLPLGCLLFETVEAILAHKETWPDESPVDGTIGYESLNSDKGLFVDSSSQRAFCARFVGEPLDLKEIAHQSKRLAGHMNMASEQSLLGLVILISCGPWAEQLDSGGTGLRVSC
ncbi:MAG: hypothetical protein AB7O62_10880 [Pirellulales bacterium]